MFLKTLSIIIIFNLIFMTNTYTQINNKILIAKNGVDLDAEIDSGGNIHFVWVSLEADSLKYLITDALLNTITDSTTIPNSRGDANPAITISDSIVNFVWRDRRINNSHIVGTLFNSSEKIYSDQIYYNEDLVSDIERFFPQIAYVNDTTFLVVWQGSGYPALGDNQSIFGQFFNNNLKFIGNNFLPNKHDELPSDISSINPKVIAMHNTNDFVIFWIDDYSGRDQIYAQKFTGGGVAIDSICTITNNILMSDLYHFDVALDNENNLAVVWSTNIDEEGIINLRWFNKDCLPISDIIKVNETNNKNIYYSNVAINANNEGSVIVAWEGSPVNNIRLLAQRFSTDHNFLGPNFEIPLSNPTSNPILSKLLFNESLVYCFWRETGANLYATVFDFFNPPVSIREEIGYDLAKQIQLDNCYPNPFNHGTNISFYVTQKGSGSIVIYDILGKEIIKLIDNQFLKPGNYTKYWDGKNNKGEVVSSGVYYMHLTFNSNVLLQKLIHTK